MRYTVIACIGYLLLSGTAYAEDCVTYFDNSCIKQPRINTPSEDAAYNYRMQQIEEMQRHAQEDAQAAEAAEQARARAEAEWRREMREQERLRLEAEQLQEMRRQGREIQGLRGDVADQERALKQMQQDMQMRELMR